MSIYTNLELAKFQVEHNRIIWDRLNIGIRQIILYSDHLFPSVKNETNYKDQERKLLESNHEIKKLVNLLEEKDNEVSS